MAHEQRLSIFQRFDRWVKSKCAERGIQTEDFYKWELQGQTVKLVFQEPFRAAYPVIGSVSFDKGDSRNATQKNKQVAKGTVLEELFQRVGSEEAVGCRRAKRSHWRDRRPESPRTPKKKKSMGGAGG